MGVIITADDDGSDELKKWLQELKKNVRYRIQFYAKAKLIMFQDVMNHFKREEGPEGKWQKLSKLTLYRRRKKGKGAKILRDTGRLMGDITAISGNDGAEVGTNDIRARTHQEGDKERNIPARTFAFLSEEANERILDVMVDYLWS